MSFVDPFRLAAASAALAQNQVALTSDVLVERTTTAPDGTTRVALEPPASSRPRQDRLRAALQQCQRQPAADFVVTNPIPDSVQFENAESANAVYSVDGGQNWGALAALSVRQPDGSSRAAAPADVTHVRWRFAQPIPAGQSGELRFRGTVK